MTLAILLSSIFTQGAVFAEQSEITMSELPEFAKSEAQGKLSKIVMFTAKSGKYKIVAFTRTRSKKEKLETRIVAYELLKGAKLASVIRSTKFKLGSDYKFQEVENWKYKNNPVLVITKNVGANKIECEVFVFDGPEMKQVNSFETSKISLGDKNDKGEMVLVAGAGASGTKSDQLKMFRWNGEKLVQM